MEDKKSLLKKLHALAERGDAGEREAAEAALERLSKKYGIAHSFSSFACVTKVSVSSEPTATRSGSTFPLVTL